MAEQIGKFLTELPEATSLKSDDLMYVVASNTSSKIGINNLKKSVSPIVKGTSSGAVVSFTDGSDNPLEKCIVEIVPKQAGTGTPSPDNVRAISGYTAVKVDVAGKNLLPTTNTETVDGVTYTPQADGSVKVVGTSTGTRAKYIWLNGKLPSGNYILSAGNEVTANGVRLTCGITRAGGNVQYYDCTSSAEKPFSFYDDDQSISVYMRTNGGSTAINATVYPMIRLASEADATFEPYKGSTTTTPLGQTVYGGQLNVLTGELVIDREFISFDGSENWQENAGQNGYTLYNILPTAMTRGNGISNEFYVQTSYYTDISLILGQNSRHIYAIRINNNISGVTDLASWKSWLSNNNCQICFEVAPQTVQLTPQEVDSILGQNNISADTGSIDIVYARDLNIVINDLLERVATLENE